MMADRHSIRLQGYNYSESGYYFVTIDIQDKLKLFWNNEKINLAGKMIENCWMEMRKRFEIELDEFVVMPNHFHGIVKIPIRWEWAAIKAARTLNQENVGVGFMPTRNNLGEIIGSFKSITTGKYIYGVRHNDWSPFDGRLWQRDYYERIVRNENELNRIRIYIKNNPKKYLCGLCNGLCSGLCRGNPCGYPNNKI